MRRKEMRLIAAAILVVVFGLWIPAGECLRPSPDAKTPEEATSKSDEDISKLIREREISKREADKRIREKEREKAERANTVEVRVHAGGADPLSKNREVIMTTQISKEDLKSKNFSEVRRKAHESRLAYARSNGEQVPEKLLGNSIDEKPANRSETSNATVLLLLGAIGAGGFWYIRQQGSVA